MRGLGLLFCLLLCLPLRAESVPPLRQRVTDLTGSIPAERRQHLEARLQAFESRKGAQLAVLVVPTTAPETAEQYALRVVEAWKLGRKGIDDGALLLVAKQDRTLRIEVGYGLEGVLPDAIAKRIISDVIVPRFQQGDFVGGIEAGLEQMMRVVDGEPLPAPKPKAPKNDFAGWLPLLFFVVIFMGGLLRAIFGRLLGAAVGGMAGGILIWVVSGLLAIGFFAGLFTFLFILMGNSGRRGSFVGSSGYGGFGGGGGGGFSGGGGSFGGGGASGRW